MSEDVVVFGATSYVGGRLIPRLLDAGHRVVGVSRRPALARIFLPQESPQFSIASAQEAASSRAGEPFSIVNLAHVKYAPPHRRFRQDRVLAGSIGEVARRGCTRIVHISTAAVFGYTFSEPPRPVRVRWRPMDSLYAESKIRAERLIEKLANGAGSDLAVVRLGNVIGPGSPVWVARPAQRMLEAQPLGYDGEAGFSNATHVENVAGYILDLLREPDGLRDRFGTYHHLAELSSHRWPEFFDVFSEAIGCRWTTVARPRGSASRRVRPPRPERALAAAYETTAGGYTRAILSLAPESEALDRWVSRRRTPTPSLGGGRARGGDEGLLELLCTPHEFRSRALGDWQPDVDFASACAGIGDWLRASGYSLEPPPSG